MIESHLTANKCPALAAGQGAFIVLKILMITAQIPDTLQEFFASGGSIDGTMKYAGIRILGLGA
jgi:hypothetical protein